MPKNCIIFFFFLIDGVSIHNLRCLLNEFNGYDYFNLSERLSYIQQACSGLEYLNNTNILCMDLKATNMLVTGKKEAIVVKLADFGEISFFQSTVTRTLTTSTLKGL